MMNLIAADGLNYFIPVRVNDEFNLLAVWAMDPYIEMIYDYYNAFKDDLFNENLIICGDLNSDVRLDYHHPKSKNFKLLVKCLEEDGLVDAYHYLNEKEAESNPDVEKEEWGKELQATFFQTKKLNYRFHLDHVFSASDVVKSLDIVDNVKWIKLSDYLPLVFEI